MWQGISQPEGISSGPGNWGSPVWHLPRLRCPGRMWQPLEVYTDDRQDTPQVQPQEGPGGRWHITNQEAQHIAAAVLAQALRDAQTMDKSRRGDREAARSWLRSREVFFWLDLLSNRITQADINAVLAKTEMDRLRH